jgi:cytochrome b
MKNTVLVWDYPTRIVHWTLVVCFVGLFITGDSERWRDIHAWLGYTMVALFTFRILWGFVGSRHARFSEFVKGPHEVMLYLRSLLQVRPIHYLGHNPAGALAILALIVLGLTTGITGWMALEEIGGEVFEELHEGLSYAMLAVVLLHVAGVVVSSLLHRENLVRAMVTGKKEGKSGDNDARAHFALGILLLLLMLGLWGWALNGHLPTTLLGGSSTEFRAEEDGDD